MDPPAFPCVFIVLIKDILHGKAGTGGTDKITAPAGYAAAVIFLPHRMSCEFRSAVLRQPYLNLVLPHIVGLYILFRKLHGFQDFCKRLPPAVQLPADALPALYIPGLYIPGFNHIDSSVVIPGLVCSHGYAESTFAGMGASHQHKPHPLPKTSVIVILGPVI